MILYAVETLRYLVPRHFEARTALGIRDTEAYAAITFSSLFIVKAPESGVHLCSTVYVSMHDV